MLVTGSLGGLAPPTTRFTNERSSIELQRPYMGRQDASPGEQCALPYRPKNNRSTSWVSPFQQTKTPQANKKPLLVEGAFVVTEFYFVRNLECRKAPLPMRGYERHDAVQICISLMYIIYNIELIVN